MTFTSHLILLPILLVIKALTANAQIVSLGACPKVPQVADFQPQRYGGLWYEQEKYPFIFELGGKCITAEYSLSADNTITVVNRQISTITGSEQKIFGSARRVGPSKLLVKFPMSFNIEAPYEVLDTDYSNYAVVYSCNDLGLVHTTVVWILTRDRFPNLDIMLKAYYAMDRAKLNRALLTRTDQQHCESPDKKYIHVSAPVKIAKHYQLVLPAILLASSLLSIKAQIASLGICPDVPKQRDFHPEQFVGLWYEQVRYPNVFEMAAKCVTSEYSLNADKTFTITNKQINSLTGNESKYFGSARRTKVSKYQIYNTVNHEKPYWILGTDYYNYAVIYTCSELGLLNTKNVWILTRDRFPEKAVLLKAYFVMEVAKLNRALLQHTDQKHCEPVRKLVYKYPKTLIG